MAASRAEEADTIRPIGGAAVTTKSSHEEIARRAYELYIARGAGDGLDLHDWLEAELQLSKSTGRPANKQVATSTGRRFRRR